MRFLLPITGIPQSVSTCWHKRCRLDPGHVLKLKLNVTFSIVRSGGSNSAPAAGNRMEVFGPSDGRLEVTCNLRITDWAGRKGHRQVRPAGEWSGRLSAELWNVRIIDDEVDDAGAASPNPITASYLNHSLREWGEMFQGNVTKNREVLKLLGYGPEDVPVPDDALPMVLALVAIGKSATQCRCLGILRTLKNPSNEVLDRVIGALGSLSTGNCHRAGSILARFEARKDYIVQLREVATMALGRMGPMAIAALPALEALQGNANESLGKHLESAIALICKD